MRDTFYCLAGRKTLTKTLHKHVSATKSKYKWLTGGVIFIEAIPKSPSGKILRRVLRDQSKALRAQAQKPSAKL